MPCLNFQLTIEPSRDLVDTERLRLHGIGWLGKDDIPLLQLLCMDAICRADEFQLIASVSLFRYGTGQCICQHSDAVILKSHFSGII